MDSDTQGRPADRWQLGNPYERYVGRWSRRVAPAFVSWLALPAGLRWLDVGCGTGALCAAIADQAAPASLTGVEPSDGFLALARETLGTRAQWLQGHAAALPLADASVDVVVSGLVLNFVPDLRAALAEAARVAAPGATFGAYVWDYAGRMDLMRHFWDAAQALDAAAAALDEGVRFPLCRPDALRAQLADAGCRDPQVTAIDVPTRFADFDDYWTPFLGGQGPAPSYAMSLDDAARSRLRDALRRRLPTAADGSIDLVARAWAVRAMLPTA
ncbi:MAG TPA: class I SAM-dependent methyltransferase [Burkholderiaceae bacterium]|nr:class I SAM-dependent methyltransferase [Burkholderiaceae bacterium]